MVIIIIQFCPTTLYIILNKSAKQVFKNVFGIFLPIMTAFCKGFDSRSKFTLFFRGLIAKILITSSLRIFC